MFHIIAVTIQFFSATDGQRILGLLHLIACMTYFSQFWVYNLTVLTVSHNSELISRNSLFFHRLIKKVIENFYLWIQIFFLAVANLCCTILSSYFTIPTSENCEFFRIWEFISRNSEFISYNSDKMLEFWDKVTITFYVFIFVLWWKLLPSFLYSYELWKCLCTLN